MPPRLVDLTQPVQDYSQVFVDKGFARVPAEEHMRIQMKPGWQDMVPKKCRVYPVGPDDRKIIEQTMEGLTQAGKAYLAPPTPYYMVSIDFLLSLPKSTEGNDSILVIVDKFSKQVMLESCKNNVTAAECTRLLYNDY
ncbi:hypothetical protein E4U44_008488 [Claviceps purpurea]|nr:hypothetical protein E4U44_008488 [Claviceps purpurea]